MLWDCSSGWGGSSVVSHPYDISWVSVYIREVLDARTTTAVQQHLLTCFLWRFLDLGASRAPEPLPILKNPSNFVPQNGFPRDIFLVSQKLISGEEERKSHGL